MRMILKNFHLVDERSDRTGTLVIENGFISDVFPDVYRGVMLEGLSLQEDDGAAMIINGKALSSSGELPLLMPAFIDLHAHFRDPGPLEKDALLPFPAEVLESASLSAAAGGFGTVVCMANTTPPIDTIEKAAALKRRSDALGIVDIYPVLSLTKNMEGKELSEITRLSHNGGSYVPPMLSEDGKDIADDDLFLAAMGEAKRLGIPVSCHCDLGGDENSAVRRVIELGKKADCRIHIAHLSTREAIDTIYNEQCEVLLWFDSPNYETEPNFEVTSEATPHHLCLTEEDAKGLGEKTGGRVNPPLRSEEDRQALMHALTYGVVNGIATDHAPHTAAGKEAGAPGFSGFETAFAAVYTELVRGGAGVDLKLLSSLMSAGPANLLGLDDGPQARGCLLPGYRADLVIIDPAVEWLVEPESLRSRGKNSPFQGRKLFGKILATLHGGRVVFSAFPIK